MQQLNKTYKNSALIVTVMQGSYCLLSLTERSVPVTRSVTALALSEQNKASR